MSVEAEMLYRTIKQSPEILEGIQNGLYKIYGGVVRIAKGHDNAGSIVAHLIFPNNAEKAQEGIENLKKVLSSKLDNLQNGIESIQGSLGTLQTLQSANLALSGLNLAVSAAGFVIVCRKLNHIDSVLQGHTQQLDALLSLALDARQREAFRDIASFNAVISTAKQFLEMGEITQLQSLIHPLNQQYEFTRLMLKNTAKAANEPAFYHSLHELSILQERFMHLGLFRSYIQHKIGAAKFAVQSLETLQNDWLEINQSIVDDLSQSPATLHQLTRGDGGKLIDFLNFRKAHVEALAYQTELLRLAESKPEVLQLLNAENDEVLFIAA